MPGADIHIEEEPQAGMQSEQTPPVSMQGPLPPMPPPPPKKPIVSIDMKIRKTLSDDLIISDHADIDIVIMMGTGKIIVFPKNELNDIVYGAQDRLFKFLSRKGIVVPDSIQGGNVYGSLEGQMMASEKYDVVNLVIINISKWIDEEKPYFEFGDEYEEMTSDRFTDPEDEESTELGEVPHDDTKGTLRPGYNYGPYWQNYTY
jgi:hypothetical protein